MESHCEEKKGIVKQIRLNGWKVVRSRRSFGVKRRGKVKV